MLLQLIVAKLDAELSRLQELRRIVNGISSASPLDGLPMKLDQLQEMPPMLLFAPETAAQANLSSLRHLTAPKSRTRSKHPENRALTSTIPATPVVVLAAQVASERQRRTPARAAATGRNKAVAFMAKSRPEVTPSVEALRSRWLAEG